MQENLSVSAAIAARYAAALFELATETEALDDLERDVVVLRDAIHESKDLRTLIRSPLYSREQMAAAISGTAELLELSGFMRNTLSLMATNRRLFAAPAMLDRIKALVDEKNGVVIAKIVSAHELSESEVDELAEALRRKVGKTVRFELSVDKNLIGGLVVKLGSKMVDSSVRTHLSHLKTTMQEVG